MSSAAFVLILHPTLSLSCLPLTTATSSSAPGASSTPIQAPPAAPAAPAPQGVAAGAGAGVDPKVAKLMALGFSKEQCEAALRMAGGNEEYAASVLFEQGM